MAALFFSQMLVASISAFIFLLKFASTVEILEPAVALPLDLASLLPVKILQDLYYHNGIHYYLPPNTENRKLLEIVEPTLVSKIMSINEGAYKSFFLIPIWKNYIIPHFLVEKPSCHACRVLPNLPNIYDALNKPIKQLLWCIFLATGLLQKDRNSVNRAIAKGFKDMKFVWKNLRSGLPNVDNFKRDESKRVKHMLPIYIMACCLNISILEIANRIKPGCEMSDVIKLGRIPPILKFAVQFDSLKIFYSIFEASPDKVPTMIFEASPAKVPSPAMINQAQGINNSALPKPEPVQVQPVLLLSPHVSLFVRPGINALPRAAHIPQTLQAPIPRPFPHHQTRAKSSSSRSRTIPPPIPFPIPIEEKTHPSLNIAEVIHAECLSRKRLHSPEKNSSSKKRKPVATIPIMALVLDGIDDSEETSQ